MHCCTHTYMCYVFMSVNKQVGSLVSELTADSVTER